MLHQDSPAEQNSPAAPPDQAAQQDSSVLRVLVLSVHSPGEAYERMKLAMHAHCASKPAGVDVWFVYGDAAPELATPLDKHLDVEECLAPGMMRKTLLALRERSNNTDTWRRYDYVVRTNASTWIHWANLESLVARLPREGVFAGFSPDRSHVSGCFTLTSRDVVGRMLEAWDALYDDPDLDDLVLSRLMMPLYPPTWLPRLDIHGRIVNCHVADEGTAQQALRRCAAVRIKSGNRLEDARIMARMVEEYATGTRDLVALAHMSCFLGFQAFHFSQVCQAGRFSRTDRA